MDALWRPLAEDGVALMPLDRYDWSEIRYAPDEEGPEETVKHAQFRLDGETFMAMDGPGEHDFTFSEALSLLVRCESQQEVDRYWEALGRGGDPAARRCGWLKDEFGVSWQVCPTVLQEMLATPTPRGSSA